MDRIRLTIPPLGPTSRWINPAAWVLFGHAVLIILVLWGELALLRAGLAIILVLFGSGYSLVTALFPSSSDLDWLERFTLAGGLSLAIGGILGFALAGSKWGLQLGPLLSITIVFNLICYAVTVYRDWHEFDKPSGGHIDDYVWAPEANRYRDPATGRWVSNNIVRTMIKHNINRATHPTPPTLIEAFYHRVSVESTASIAFSIALTLLIATGVWALGHTIATGGEDPPLTEFFLLDSIGLAEAYPSMTHPNQPLAIHYGIVNHEDHLTTYRVEATVEGETIGESEAITLGVGESLQADLVLIWPEQGPAAQPGSHKVEFTLFRDEQQHRSLHLWLEVNLQEAMLTGREASTSSGP